MKQPVKSAYVHIPFCLSKCRYCAFNSEPLPEAWQVERYCRSMEMEMRNAGSALGRLGTVYFGGGTPTVLEAVTLGRLMDQVQKASGGTEVGAEVTIEANPETVDGEMLDRLLAIGFNRISLGLQSFDDTALSLMGRAHDGRRAAEAFGAARNTGFGNIGVDLIYGIPGQTLEGWREDVGRAVDLGPEHVSAYSLTYEPGTEFTAWRDLGRIEPCENDLEADMFLVADEMLGTAGYEHYEVSNYARPGFRSRHNLNYWRCGDYLGFGAGAHSHQGGKRSANVGAHEKYAESIERVGNAVEFEETLNREQMVFEALFLGLRMTGGIDVRAFAERWGIEPQNYRPEVWGGLAKEGLAEVGPETVRLSFRGLLVSDSLLSRFSP